MKCYEAKAIWTRKTSLLVVVLCNAFSNEIKITKEIKPLSWLNSCKTLLFLYNVLFDRQRECFLMNTLIKDNAFILLDVLSIKVLFNTYQFFVVQVGSLSKIQLSRKTSFCDQSLMRLLRKRRRSYDFWSWSIHFVVRDLLLKDNLRRINRKFCDDFWFQLGNT